MTQTAQHTCEICGGPAQSLTRHNHPDPSLQWEAPLCEEHMKEAFDKGHGGSYTFLPLPDHTEPLPLTQGVTVRTGWDRASLWILLVFALLAGLECIVLGFLW